MAPIARTTALVIALVVAAPVAAAQVYKWVDEDGVTHYTQQPPPGGEAQVIDPNVAEPSAAAPAGGSGEDTAAAGDGSGESSGDDGDSQSMAEFCNQLRDEAQLLASDRPVKVQSGDRVTDLTGEARQQRLASTRSQIEQYCGDQGS